MPEWLETFAKRWEVLEAPVVNADCEAVYQLIAIGREAEWGSRTHDYDGYLPCCPICGAIKNVDSHTRDCPYSDEYGKE